MSCKNSVHSRTRSKPDDYKVPNDNWELSWRSKLDIALLITFSINCPALACITLKYKRQKLRVNLETAIDEKIKLIFTRRCVKHVSGEYRETREKAKHGNPLAALTSDGLCVCLTKMRRGGWEAACQVVLLTAGDLIQFGLLGRDRATTLSPGAAQRGEKEVERE